MCRGVSSLTVMEKCSGGFNHCYSSLLAVLFQHSTSFAQIRTCNHDRIGMVICKTDPSFYGSHDPSSCSVVDLVDPSKLTGDGTSSHVIKVTCPCQSTATNRGGWTQLPANANVLFKVNLMYYIFLFGEQKINFDWAHFWVRTRNQLFFVSVQCKTTPPSFKTICYTLYRLSIVV